MNPRAWTLPRKCLGFFSQVYGHSLGRRMLAAILVCSTLLALAATAVQLLVDYRRELSQLDQRMRTIEVSYLESLAISVWQFDQESIRSQLAGISRLQDIRAAEITSEWGARIERAGLPPSDAEPIARVMPLVFEENGKPVRVGTLTITASLDGVYQRLADRVLVILATQTVKTFVVAVFILLIFQRMVSRPLGALARYARSVDLKHLDKPLVLPRPPRPVPDEFDVLVCAINEMRDSIRRDFEAISHMQRTLALNEERYRGLVESTNVVPWEADPQTWRFSFVGPQAEGMLGYTRADWHRPDFWNARINPEDAAGLRAVHKVGERFQAECRLRDADGLEHWIGVQAVLRGTSERPVLQGYFLDIDRRKRAEAELARYRNELERLVEQRTAELAQQVSRLEETQHQLLLSEKMASLGQLAAGVAHEINNPVGFVAANLDAMEGYWRDTVKVLEAYRRCEALLPPQAEEINQLRSVKTTADIDYLVDDVPQLIEESRDGIARVTQIVHDLRHFSHTDPTGAWQLADLHQGLDSTVNIVRNQFKDKAELVKDYGDLPPVRCLPSQLNQVFMNLLVNAAHAIEDRGTITIRTRTRDCGIVISIADTGSGIKPEDAKRIFNPFFTTKPVGKGTGMGLSLAYGIIERHRGRIDVDSTPGKGTTFNIWIPLTDETSAPPAPAGQMTGR